MSARRSFTAKFLIGPKKQAYIPLPFEPDAVWGSRPRHLIIGTIAGRNFRGAIETVEGQPALAPKPAWVRDNPLPAGGEVEVDIAPEGPQRGNLDPDILAALESAPDAAAFFDGLAQFYRRAYLTWIDGTKKRPDERDRRIAEMITHLQAGRKERPK